MCPPKLGLYHQIIPWTRLCVSCNYVLLHVINFLEQMNRPSPPLLILTCFRDKNFLNFRDEMGKKWLFELLNLPKYQTNHIVGNMWLSRRICREAVNLDLQFSFQPCVWARHVGTGVKSLWLLLEPRKTPGSHILLYWIFLYAIMNYFLKTWLQKDEWKDETRNISTEGSCSNVNHFDDWEDKWASPSSSS